MKKQNIYFAVLTLMAFLTFGCNEAAEENLEKVAAVIEPDMVAVKAQIQDLENVWSKAQAEGDVEGLLAMWADDGISMSDGKPAVVGKDALRKDMEEGFAKRTKGNVTTFETTEVFGNPDLLTETGTSITKDANGTVLETGKYMAIWKKSGDTYTCIRDIYNSDTAKK